MSEHSRLVASVADLASAHTFRVGVAESLTSGQLAADLGAGPEASTWFRGGVVAYASEVKFAVLGVTPGPVVTERCAREMAEGAASLLGADAVVATTGVGGPDPEEGEPPGRVYVAAYVRGGQTCERLDLSGEPPDVLEQTRVRALALLREAMERSLESVSGPRRPGTGRDGGPAGSPSPATSR
ncbi:CinA family protein [Nocardioides pocheonensis]|uniref:CinA family protein n=1 Tax=Nocardioides pocheonensis TaxID=661485 RepID=A0A3N0GGF6_9ACTN|nr:CinA family protein [Nocardioides pocheonensis]RNM11120.1 CinA family protein [Nocardioides pocheonensis]